MQEALRRSSGWRGAVAVLLLLPALAAAEPVGPELTPKLDRLLRQEMRAIDKAMTAIFSAIVTGDHGKVADQAQRIHDSFILKQNLTAADRSDLQRAVPKAFVELDQAFHADAGALAKAARARDAARELALFQDITRACLTCHSRYATDRFPGLAGVERRMNGD
jgi:cytochrome c556